MRQIKSVEALISNEIFNFAIEYDDSDRPPIPKILPNSYSSEKLAELIPNPPSLINADDIELAYDGKELTLNSVDIFRLLNV